MTFHSVAIPEPTLLEESWARCLGRTSYPAPGFELRFSKPGDRRLKKQQPIGEFGQWLMSEYRSQADRPVFEVPAPSPKMFHLGNKTILWISDKFEWLRSPYGSTINRHLDPICRYAFETKGPMDLTVIISFPDKVKDTRVDGWIAANIYRDQDDPRSTITVRDLNDLEIGQVKLQVTPEETDRNFYTSMLSILWQYHQPPITPHPMHALAKTWAEDNGMTREEFDRERLNVVITNPSYTGISEVFESKSNPGGVA